MPDNSLKQNRQKTLGITYRRLFKDRFARYFVNIGGISVIFAIVLIFFYLVYAVFPLFESAKLTGQTEYVFPGSEQHQVLHLATDEQKTTAMAVLNTGYIKVFDLINKKNLKQIKIPLAGKVNISSCSLGDPSQGIIALGLSNGKALVVNYRFDVSFPNGQRLVDLNITYPFGESGIPMTKTVTALEKITLQSHANSLVLVAVTPKQELLITSMEKKNSLLEDEQNAWQTQQSTLKLQAAPIAFLLMDQEARRLYLVDNQGELIYYNIRDKTQPILAQRTRLVAQGDQVTAINFLAGGISLLVGNQLGQINQWFPVRDANNNELLTHIRSFQLYQKPITVIAAEARRKGFAAADTEGNIGIYHATSERNLIKFSGKNKPITHAAISPHADGLLVYYQNHEFSFWQVKNQHPEVSWSGLWGKVWYENYTSPEFIWQSSSASDDFEPKFSLVPLSLGTLKAAFYALLFAVPLAIMGAMFTAAFMSSRMRAWVKPGIEIMAALPTVILGFLAGLWLAPYMENHLPGIFALLTVLPLGILAVAFLWQKLPAQLRRKVPEGWEAALLLPVVALLVAATMGISPVMEEILFAGDIRKWLSNDLGIPFDQRNALVVGVAMGFAVIPIIFTIAEDAIFGVPKTLTQGSLALGASYWQTLTRVVLLTASPGIFSAVMIGLGRAVGETMIVLMATGNTAIMDLSFLQGMRTLSANIAVEIPESALNSSHYRVLFLAALVLFLFTLILNTLAEIVRQNLRKKYSSL